MRDSQLSAIGTWTVTESRPKLTEASSGKTVVVEFVNIFYGVQIAEMEPKPGKATALNSRSEIERSK